MRIERIAGGVVTTLFLLGLSCSPAAAGQVTVTWIAPGDDCDLGTASGFELVLTQDSSAIVAVLQSDTLGSTCGGTHSGVNRQVIDLAVPGLSWRTTYANTFAAASPAGFDQAFTITQLAEGTWYFTLRAYDEAANIAPWAPFKSWTIDVTEPAAISFGLEP